MNSCFARPETRQRHEPVLLGLLSPSLPALPKQLLDAAGVGAGEDLIARVEGPGRIVLEDAATVLARLQSAVREGMAVRGHTGSLAEELIAERAADTSLEAAPSGDREDGSGADDAKGARHAHPVSDPQR